jgi:two-component system sensor histidine kinase/response regulator
MSVLYKLTNKIAGEYPSVGINERAARITCLFTACNYFAGFIAAAYLGLGFYYTMFQLAAAIPFFALFYLLVKRKYVQQVIMLLVVILSGSFIIGWFYAGGINGPFIAGGLVIFYVALNIVLVKNRLQVSLFMISVMSITIIMSYMHPHWVTDYPQSSGRYIDYMLMVIQLSAYFIFIEASNRHCYHYEQNLVLQRNRELEQVNDDQLRLFTIISHDLKGPMTTLKGILNSVEEGFATPEKLQRQLTHLKTMTTPLNNTLNNLLLWSRQQLEGLNAAPELFMVGEILQEEILLAAEEAEANGVSITNSILPNTKVFADMNLLRVVFRNLISNAIHHANKKTVVELAYTATNQMHIFKVSNAGVVIPLKAAEEFNLTGKLEGIKPSNRQHGLGLQLCQGFVKINGGTIWIDTSVSTQTVFCFSLPKT